MVDLNKGCDGLSKQVSWVVGLASSTDDLANIQARGYSA